MSVLHVFFFFNGPATTEIYPLSLHDALPISSSGSPISSCKGLPTKRVLPVRVSTSTCLSEPTPIATTSGARDRKSTRLNSSHSQISYAVFCLKKKKKNAVSQLPAIHTTAAGS